MNQIDWVCAKRIKCPLLKANHRVFINTGLVKSMRLLTNCDDSMML